MTQTTGQERALNFYERMQIDTLMRQNKEENTNETDTKESYRNKEGTLESEDLSSEISIDTAEEEARIEEEKRDQEKQEFFKIHALSEQLRIPFKKAKEIYDIT